jgi:hypothetical protein
MEELELLKTHWKKQDDFPKKSKIELHKIIKRSSSNTLKWMIAANIFELLFLVALGIYFGQKDADYSHLFLTNTTLIAFFNILDYVIIAIPIVFSIIYIYMIRKIQITDSISDLLNNVLNARKLLNLYIYINLCIFIGIISFSMIYTYDEVKKMHVEGIENLSEGWIFGIHLFSIVITFVLLSGIVWLFYKLLYGKLLKRLKRNIQDLNEK